MIKLESLKPKIGAVVAVEGLGVALLVTAFNLTTEVLPIAMVYFICVLLTYEVSNAQLNPAVTMAMYFCEGKWKENSGVTMFIIGGQIIGAFLGLEFGMLLRVIYSLGTKAEPDYNMMLPGV